MTKYKPLPPLERLNELLEVVEIPPDKYGEWSGLVRKIGRMGGGEAGSVAGSPLSNPKRPNRRDWRVTIDNNKYFVSRVIYCMTYGEDPGNVQVDHKDQNIWNNNVWNLRLDVNGNIQKVNSSTQRNNTSGITGIFWHKKRKRWKAQVCVKSKIEHLGYFACKKGAARVVRDKWIELEWDKLGRKLPDLNKIECECSDCSNMTARPSDPAE